MDFHYGTSFGKATPEAYERLLLDAISGDATLFARHDEVEEAWKFVDAIRAGWNSNGGDLVPYAAETWGPMEPDELIKRYGGLWETTMSSLHNVPINPPPGEIRKDRQRKFLGPIAFKGSRNRKLSIMRPFPRVG